MTAPPASTPTWVELYKAWLRSAVPALMYSQILTATVALSLLLCCDFLKALPRPEYTVPAETLQHWLQEGNYTPCRKHWWIPPRRRLLLRAVVSHIVDSFLMFWPAVTQDDCVVCCLATYSNFVLDFFFQSRTPLGLFSDSTFLVSCHLSKSWNHLRALMLFSKMIPAPTSAMSFTKFKSVHYFRLVNRNTSWKWKRTSRTPLEMAVLFQNKPENCPLRRISSFLW